MASNILPCWPAGAESSRWLRVRGSISPATLATSAECSCSSSGERSACARLLVSKLGGAARLPPVPPLWEHTPPTPPDTANAATITTGFELFSRFCLPCHGNAAVGGGGVPELRKSPFLP